MTHLPGLVYGLNKALLLCVFISSVLEFCIYCYGFCSTSHNYMSHMFLALCDFLGNAIYSISRILGRDKSLLIVCAKEVDYPKLYVKKGDTSKIIAIFSVVYYNFFIKINSPNHMKTKGSLACTLLCIQGSSGSNNLEIRKRMDDSLPRKPALTFGILVPL